MNVAKGPWNPTALETFLVAPLVCALRLLKIESKHFIILAGVRSYLPRPVNPPLYRFPKLYLDFPISA
jgi:hypothetical protein